jgi:hypothetical protein
MKAEAISDLHLAHIVGKMMEDQIGNLQIYAAVLDHRRSGGG